MKRYWPLLLLTASIAASQTSPKPEIADADLEAAHQANPNDFQITGRLLSYYARDNRDSAWSARFALLSSNIEQHPDAAFFASRDFYLGMPKPMREQLKQMWIAQVQQHPDNPRVLRNAATAMETQTSAIRVGGMSRVQI